MTKTEALLKARDQFRFYAEQHRAKNTEDGDAKAVVNDEMAAMCDAALPDDKTEWIDATDEGTQFDVKDAAKHLTFICHGLAAQSGWWSRPDALAPHMTPTRLMLMVSELGEAMEGDRKGLMDDHLPHRSSLEVELADLVIRAFDMAGGQKLDLAGAIAEKLAYNARRADHRLEERAKVGGKKY